VPGGEEPNMVANGQKKKQQKCMVSLYINRLYMSDLDGLNRLLRSRKGAEKHPRGSLSLSEEGLMYFVKNSSGGWEQPYKLGNIGSQGEQGKKTMENSPSSNLVAERRGAVRKGGTGL